MEFAAGNQVSVIMSSHLMADLEGVCDYLIVLVASRVRVAGEVEDLLATHHLLTGARAIRLSCHRTGRSFRPVTATGRPLCWSAPAAPSTTPPGPWPRSAWKTWSWPI